MRRYLLCFFGILLCFTLLLKVNMAFVEILLTPKFFSPIVVVLAFAVVIILHGGLFAFSTHLGEKRNWWRQIAVLLVIFAVRLISYMSINSANAWHAFVLSTPQILVIHGIAQLFFNYLYRIWFIHKAAMDSSPIE